LIKEKTVYKLKSIRQQNKNGRAKRGKCCGIDNEFVVDWWSILEDVEGEWAYWGDSFRHPRRIRIKIRHQYNYGLGH